MPNKQSPAAAMMPRWKCHKEVFAVKIMELHPGRDDGNGPGMTIVGDDGNRYMLTEAYLAKHDPVEGGYFVVYDDGYQSFSPCKAFEDGYTRIS